MRRSKVIISEVYKKKCKITNVNNFFLYNNKELQFVTLLYFFQPFKRKKIGLLVIFPFSPVRQQHPKLFLFHEKSKRKEENITIGSISSSKQLIWPKQSENDQILTLEVLLLLAFTNRKKRKSNKSSNATGTNFHSLSSPISPKTLLNSFCKSTMLLLDCTDTL